jgi:hypothetical protein
MKNQMHHRSTPHTFLCLLVLGISGLLVTSPVSAQTMRKSAAELASASQVSINGRGAAAGLTLFSDSRIKTARQGRATINLGSLGRVELGPDTDLTLKFSPGTVGGELNGGHLMLSSSKGVSLSIRTAKGLITSSGESATVATIEMTEDQARVAAHLGEVMVAAPGKTERVLAGDEIALAKPSQGAGWQHHKLLVAAGGALGTGGVFAARQLGQAGQVGQVAIPATTNASQLSAPLSSMLNAGFNYSLTNLVHGPEARDPQTFFSTTITCRDHDNALCKRRSQSRP